MNIRRFLAIATLMCLLPSVAPSQNAKLDQSFFGLWNLDVGKSDFASQPKPRMGQVNWGGHGWTFALVLANGEKWIRGREPTLDSKPAHFSHTRTIHGAITILAGFAQLLWNHGAGRGS